MSPLRLVLERLAKGMRLNLDPEDVNGGVQIIGGGGPMMGRSRSTRAPTAEE